MSGDHTRTRVTIHGPEGIVASFVVARGPADVDQDAIQDAFLDRLLGDDQAGDENASTRQPEGEQ